MQKTENSKKSVFDIIRQYALETKLGRIASSFVVLSALGTPNAFAHHTNNPCSLYGRLTDENGNNTANAAKRFVADREKVYTLVTASSSIAEVIITYDRSSCKKEGARQLSETFLQGDLEHKGPCTTGKGTLMLAIEGTVVDATIYNGREGEGRRYSAPSLTFLNRITLYDNKNHTMGGADAESMSVGDSVQEKFQEKFDEQRARFDFLWGTNKTQCVMYQLKDN